MTDLSVQFQRLRRGNAILFRPDDPVLLPLADALAEADRRSVVLWGLREAERVADALSRRHPDDDRPVLAVEACREWSEGSARMGEARAAILAVHAMARDVPPGSDAALCHAVGQGCSCVHTPGHAMGLPVYELTSVLLERGEGCGGEVGRMVDAYVRDLELSRIEAALRRSWAGFLRDRPRRIPSFLSAILRTSE